jgi:ornithine cyclodeaminase/alanine dehydrogenase-like protein (mu-crystallin family)
MTHNDLTRRTFVKTSVAASSAALLSAQSPNDTVRVAFIGVGNRGAYLLQNMLKVPGVNVVAICDIDPDRMKKAVDAAAAAGHTPEAYTAFRKMLDRKDIDDGKSAWSPTLSKARKASFRPASNCATIPTARRP